MPPLVLGEAGVVALANMIEAGFKYNMLLLEKVPEQAALIAEQTKPFLALAKWFNKTIGVPD